MKHNRHTDSPAPAAHHHHKKTRQLRRALLIAGGCSIVLAGTLAFLLLQTDYLTMPGSTKKPSNDNAAITLLDETSHKTETRTITSSLGFSLRYDKKALTADGQTTDASSKGSMVTGQSYSNEELDQTRDYSIVNLRLATNDQSKSFSLQPELTVLTNIRKNYLATETAKPENKGKSKLDVFIAVVTASQLRDNPSVKTTTPTAITINGINYKKVSFTRTDSNYGVTTRYRDDFYFTVQNDRPYYVNVGNIGNATAEQISLLESVIKTVTYAAPDQSKLSSATRGIHLAANQLPSNTTNTPNTLRNSTLLSVVAKNQPAVVRVGTVYCVDADLLLPDGTVGLSLKNACNAGIGSGSFVSRNGYIATNGHVVRMDTATALSGYVTLPLVLDQKELGQSRFKEIVNYFVKSNLITANQADSFVRDLQADKPEALQTLNSLGSFIPASRITVRSDAYTYALQTSNQPFRLVVDSNGATTFNYNKTIIPATYIASNYEITPETGGHTTISSDHSDVAILKADGSFPSVTLGSIKTLQNNDELTALGFPGFVDGGLLTKRSTTVPSATQGTISEIGPPAYGTTYTVIVTDVPIAQGNSGGPSFDATGKQIGLNTYAVFSCPDRACFGNGIIRDINDYKELLADNNITLSADNDISRTWQEGLDAYEAAHYRQAAKKFDEAAKKYPAGYLMTAFKELAISKIGTTEDLSPKETNVTIILVISALVTFIVIDGVVIALLVRHAKRGKTLAYAMPPQPTAVAYPYQAAPVVYPYAPQQQPPSNQPVAPPPLPPSPITPTVPAAAPIPPQPTTLPTEYKEQ